MGLRELWLTYGPGSPGSTAKAISKSYMRIKKQFPDRTHEEILNLTLKERINIAAKFSMIPMSESKQKMVIQASEGKLKSLIMHIITHENPNTNVAANPQGFFSMCSIISKMVSKYTS